MTLSIVFSIGLIFLFSVLIKALDSRRFIRHNYYLGLASMRQVTLASFVFVGIETAVGIGLMLYVFPQYLILGTILLIFGLSALTLWSTNVGKAIDCGCYGGVVLLTPQQSLLLNAVYVSLLVTAWLNPLPKSPVAMWQLWVIFAGSLATMTMAFCSRNQPLIDLSRLKPGKMWQNKWLTNSNLDLTHGNYLLALISPNCPHCHLWLSDLNQIHEGSDLPEVVGIMGAT